MKDKSERYPYVTFDRWKTPLTGISPIDVRLGGVLQTYFQVFFFFYERKKRDKEIHVLSIPRDYPYRVMEEEYGYSGVTRYFRYKDEKAKRKRRHRTPSPGWRLWNTDMIQELDAGMALSGYGHIKPKDIIHYVIFSDDDVTEFISPFYRWELHKNITTENLVAKYVKKRYFERFGKRGKT